MRVELGGRGQCEQRLDKRVHSHERRIPERFL
jgi:hypothetical protein